MKCPLLRNPVCRMWRAPCSVTLGMNLYLSSTILSSFTVSLWMRIGSPRQSEAILDCAVASVDSIRPDSVAEVVHRFSGVEVRSVGVEAAREVV